MRRTALRFNEPAQAGCAKASPAGRTFLRPFESAWPGGSVAKACSEKHVKPELPNHFAQSRPSRISSGCPAVFE